MSHLQCWGYATEKLPLRDIIALPRDLQSTAVDTKACGNGCVSGENQHRRVAYRRVPEGAAWASAPEVVGRGKTTASLCPTVACSTARNVCFSKPFLCSPVGFLRGTRCCGQLTAAQAAPGAARWQRNPVSISTAESQQSFAHSRPQITIHLWSYFKAGEKIYDFYDFQ